MLLGGWRLLGLQAWDNGQDDVTKGRVLVDEEAETRFVRVLECGALAGGELAGRLAGQTGDGGGGQRGHSQGGRVARLHR